MPKTAIRVVDRAQMLAIETQTFHEFDTNEEIIIENVGLEAALYLQSKYKLQSDERVAIYCGKGNNAADGMALARHLHGMGLMIDLYLMFPMKDFSSQAQIQLKRLQCVQHSNLRIHECSIESRPEFNLPLRLLIDCIFGTGLNQVLGEKWQTFFRFIEKNCQRLDAPIVSIDLPSGALPDQATVDKSVLHCQLTLMVGAVKVGPMFSEAISALGELHVLRAGFPRQLTHSNVEHQLVASNNSEQQFTAPVEWHKYQKGHVLIIGGNKGMSGAAILSAIAAQRSGAGLITLGHPDGSGDEVAQRLPSDMMLLALDKNSANSLNSSLSKITSILIGPGLGRDQFSEDLWSSLLAALLLQTKKISVVVDADGLYHLANGLKNKLELPKNVNWILTPHLGELKQLLVQLPPQWTKDWELSPLGCIEKLAQHLGVHIVLKNAGATAIVSPLKKMKFHYAPCAALATAGSGDILAGMICAQLSLRRKEFVSNNQLMIEILSACVFLHNQLGQSILGQGQGALAILEKLEKSTFSEQK